jgi:DNA-binding PadR family transcriptional regulator
MHFRRHRHGPRWEAFAEKIREQINEASFGANFGAGFGDGFGSERRNHRGGGPRGRVLDSAELRLVLLKLIHDEPRHGYDLIKAIEALSGGTYAPSPGMVYPTLTLLADQGLVDETADGSRKRYASNADGAQLLADEADAVIAAIARLEDLAKINKRPEQGPVQRAMRNLQSVLQSRLSDKDASSAEARQLQLWIAEILDDAAQRIERV